MKGSGVGSGSTLFDQLATKEKATGRRSEIWFSSLPLSVEPFSLSISIVVRRWFRSLPRTYFFVIQPLYNLHDSTFALRAHGPFSLSNYPKTAFLKSLFFSSVTLSQNKVNNFILIPAPLGSFLIQKGWQMINQVEMGMILVKQNGCVRFRHWMFPSLYPLRFLLTEQGCTAGKDALKNYLR